MMIAESYDLVSDSPSKRIYEAVRKIPYGKVATYSQISHVETVCLMTKKQRI